MSSTRTVFQDPTLQKQFERRGYVIVPLLSAEEIQYLLSVPNALNHDHDNGFYTTTWLTDTPARMETHRILKEILQPRLDKFLIDYRYHYGNYFIKKPEQGSQCEVHQDWTMAEEPRHVGLTVWCALMDMTPENGCLKVLKGSHTLKNYVRGRNSYDYLRPLSAYIYQKFMRNVLMKAGQAVIFHQRLIHGSGNNCTSENRIACGIAAVPKESKIIHYAAEKDNPGNLRVLDAENDFYSRHNTFEPLHEQPALTHIHLDENYLEKKELITRYITEWFWR